jgi:hypothetical protein
VEVGRRSSDLEGMKRAAERMEAREDLSGGGKLFYYHIPWLQRQRHRGNHRGGPRQ